MHVYLVQHGKAKTTEEDPTRGLTFPIWSVVWAVVPDLLRAQTRLAA